MLALRNDIDDDSAATPAPSPGRLSILHITAPASVGGLESVVTSLARGHRDLGHEVRVLALLDGPPQDHRFVNGLCDSGIEVLPVISTGRQYLEEYRAVVDHCRRLRPSVVHAHGYRSDLIAGLGARNAGIPIVSTVHGFTGGDWKMRVYEFAQRMMFRRLDAVVVVSRPLVTQMIEGGVHRDRVHFVPNAYASDAPFERSNARRRLQLSEDDLCVGFVGRLSREKGADILLRALPLLANSSISLSIVGDGVERERLEVLAASLGVAGRIRWHGVVPEGGRCVSAFDALVLSSRTEGTPIILLEAIAAGTPVVTTSVGGIPDVVSSEDAVLVAPEDPVALARGIDAVFADRAAAKRRATSARARLDQEFAAAPWLSRYLNIYHTVRRTAGVR